MACDGNELDGRRQALWLGAILLSSFLLKLGLVFLVGEIAPLLDEEQYLYVGQSLAAGQGLRYTNVRWDPLYQPPLYPFYMGLVFKLGGAAIAAKVGNVFLSTGTVWLLFLVARRWFGARTALVSAALFAFYPDLVAFTHYNWSESFFLFWWVLAFLFLFEPGARLAGVRSLMLAGMLFGLATQTRAVLAYLVPLLVPWMALATRDLRSTLVRGTAFVASFVLCLVPLMWTVYREHGGVILSSQPAKIWYQCYNAAEPGNVDYGFPLLPRTPRGTRPPVDEANPVLRQRQEMRNALAFMADNPGLCARRFWLRLTYFFNPTSFLIRHVREGHYWRRVGEPKRAPPAAAWIEPLVAITVGSYLLTWLLAVLGLFTMPAGIVRPFVLLGSTYLVVLCALTYATSRYRLPLLPLMVPCAGYAIVHFRASVRQLARARIGIPFVLVVGGFVYVWSLYWDRIWS